MVKSIFASSGSNGQLLRTVIWVQVFLCQIAYAESDAKTAVGSWYVGLAGGIGEVEVVGHDRSEQVENVLHQRGFQTSSERGGEDDDTSVTKLMLGYRIARHWSLEASVNDLGRTDGRFRAAVTSPLVGQLEGEIESRYRAVALSVLGFYPLMTSFSLYGRAGLHYWEHEQRFISTSTLLDFGESLKDDGMDILWGVGIEYMPLQQISFRLEWERFAGVEGEEGIDGKALSIIYYFK